MRPTAIYFFSIITILIITSSCAGSPPPGHARASGFFPAKVLLQSAQNFYVTIDASNQNQLTAEELDKTKADTFYLCDLGNNVIGLQSMKERYVTIHMNKGDKAMANQTYIGFWERLEVHKKENGLAFKCVNNLFLKPDAGNNNVLTASSKTANEACLFKIIELP